MKYLGARQVHAPEEEPAAPTGRPDRSRRLSVVALVLALVPLVAALVHAFGTWTAVGDNALITLRSLDVLTRDHPLLGTWTSASRTVGFDVNNIQLHQVLGVKLGPDARSGFPLRPAF